MPFLQFLSTPLIILLTVPGGASFVDHFCYLCFKVVCSLVITFSEKADHQALLCVVVSCVFVTFPYGVPGQAWYLIVSIPDLCNLTYFVITCWERTNHLAL